jgi:hypothetical protein
LETFTHKKKKTSKRVRQGQVNVLGVEDTVAERRITALNGQIAQNVRVSLDRVALVVVVRHVQELHVGARPDRFHNLVVQLGER